MKKYILILAIIALSLPINAQNKHKSLFDTKPITRAKINYGGPLLNYTSVKSSNGFLWGGGGAAVYNKFQIGGAGYFGKIDGYKLGYGGGMIGLVFQPDGLINYSISTLIGGGTIISGENNDTFLFVEPRASINLNITPYIKGTFG